VPRLLFFKIIKIRYIKFIFYSWDVKSWQISYIFPIYSLKKGVSLKDKLILFTFISAIPFKPSLSFASLINFLIKSTACADRLASFGI